MIVEQLEMLFMAIALGITPIIQAMSFVDKKSFMKSIDNQSDVRCIQLCGNLLAHTNSD